LALQPPPGTSAIAEWNGLTVRSLRPLRNGACELPAGTEYGVTVATPGGMHIASRRCGACGVVQHLSGVSHEDVELVEPAQVPQTLHTVIRDHCDDLDRTAAVLMERVPDGSFAPVANEIRLAARELRAALAALAATSAAWASSGPHLTPSSEIR
jgi:hypothetical protein